jgi:hypothetical protein
MYPELAAVKEVLPPVLPLEKNPSHVHITGFMVDSL